MGALTIIVLYRRFPPFASEEYMRAKSRDIRMAGFDLCSQGAVVVNEQEYAMQLAYERREKKRAALNPMGMGYKEKHAPQYLSLALDVSSLTNGSAFRTHTSRHERLLDHYQFITHTAMFTHADFTDTTPQLRKSSKAIGG